MYQYTWTDLNESNCKWHEPNPDRGLQVTTMIAVTSVDPTFETEDCSNYYHNSGVVI